MFDLHRHDEFSSFDGFGKAEELAKLAKEYGYTALCTTNHGNTNGLIQTYTACKDEEIKAILGVEGYFLPKWKPQTRGYHLLLIAKNLKGYGNLNRLQYEGEKQKYYNPIWDFELLEEYKEGLVCTSACLAGYLSQCIKAGEIDKAEKYLKKMKSIFGKDFYIEVQPYKVSEKGLQEKMNVESIKLAKKLKIGLVLTSDSHRGRKEDFNSYMKMHEMANHNFEDIEATYRERYMPGPKEMQKRFYKMHKNDFGEVETKRLIREMEHNLEVIEQECELNYLDELPEILPKFDDTQDSKKLLKRKVIQGLKDRGKYTKEYIDRAKEELDTIFYLKFEDYFLIVDDYVNWAKEQGIMVGPGRGSACNYLVNYALKITEVDSLMFNLEHKRFMMKERHKMPDIDIDFETARRGEVIEYLCNKYAGHAARICSYGLYKVDNLVNELSKVCGLPTTKDVDQSERNSNKAVVAEIKKLINKYLDEGFLDMESLTSSAEAKMYNAQYDNIIYHFSKLYNKVRFIGTHAAGVAITGANILDYAAVRIDSKTGNMFTTYDLNDMENIKVVKFDMLGLSTMSEIGDCRKLTGIKDFEEYMLTDKKVIHGFSEGNCSGVFQLDKKSVQDLLVHIHTDSFNDVVAATAMNRPGPLTQKMPDLYAANKEAYEKGEQLEGSYFEDYLGKTYGTIIYQEQVMKMAVDIGGMTWDEAHKITKMKIGVSKFNDYFENDYPKYEDAFAKGAKKLLGVPDDLARDTFRKFYHYSFNEGHSVGYSLISAEQMYYKMHYPMCFWFAKMKYAKNEADYNRHCLQAVKDGAVIFLPHVNYSSPKTRIRTVEGEKAIQQGLSDIKNVGEKAADIIYNERRKNGVFISYDDFYDRCKSRAVTSRVIDVLTEQGALEFNKKTYINRVTKYNSTMYAKTLR